MGANDSVVYDSTGKAVDTRKCVILLTPPSFQTSKFIDALPKQFPFHYVSVGAMIRDQINKRTNYSQIILDHLQKHKKVSGKMLNMLLKTAALQGDFVINYSPKDEEQIEVWNRFLNGLNVCLVIIIQETASESVQQRQTYQQKHRAYKRHVASLKDNFKSKTLIEGPYEESLMTDITKSLGL